MRNKKKQIRPQSPPLNILYEDDQILLVDKPEGIIVHPNESNSSRTLLNDVRNYLRKTGAWNAKDPDAFRPMPCNRLDRFTRGIVIFAKTWDAMRVMNQKIQQHEVDKKYLCLVIGHPFPAKGNIKSYLLKNQDETHVTVHKRKVPGSQYAHTKYRTLEANNQHTLLECQLITGRTHQLRAQLAWIGHPILGDMRYGNKSHNKERKQYHQVLCAYQITFSFYTDAGVLNYLKGKTFRLRHY